MPAFKLQLASTFVLALVEEKLSPLNSLYFSTQLSLKILAKKKQNCPKNACIWLLNNSTWRKQGTSPNRLLCFSDVMFTCQGKLGEFMPASKLASTFVLAFIEGGFMPLNLHQLSWKFWRINNKRTKITRKYCFDRAEIWGKWPPKRTQEKPQGHWTPPFFPLPSWCKIQDGHSRHEPKWCKFLKLVIYLTIDVFAVIPPNVFSAPSCLW